MKRLVFLIILFALIALNFPQSANAGILTQHRAKISQNRIIENSAKQIKQIFVLQDKFTNTYDFENLYNLYDDNYVNSDGFNKETYFKLIKETWETYPDITYLTNIQNINISSNYATVETIEYANALAEEPNDYSSPVGELNSVARCIYHLKKDGGKWLITSEDILEERSALKFGDARFIKMELNAPTLVGAGKQYTAELKIDMPKDQIVIASISSEKIVQPVEKPSEKYRKLPPEQVIERIITANTDNVNEYSIASVGVTKTEPVDEESVKVYMNGLAFLMTRVNVIPENKFVKLEEVQSGKTE